MTGHLAPLEPNISWIFGSDSLAGSGAAKECQDLMLLRARRGSLRSTPLMS